MLVGVAKGAERKPGLEELISPRRRTAARLRRDHPGLHLIQAIRDEAHRFAITGHRARRGKARMTSSLESIAGIGAKRRQAAARAFRRPEGRASAASVDELAQVEGISRDARRDASTERAALPMPLQRARTSLTLAAHPR